MDDYKEVKCDRCWYVGPLRSYLPARTVYQDIQCPRCDSMNNEHNREYQKRLMERMRESTN